MKRLLPFLLLMGCAHPRVAPAPGPSVGAVKAGLSGAQSQLADAKASAERIGEKLAMARTKAQRIDGKATVLLDHWQ